MTKFNLHTIDTAPAESKDILKKSVINGALYQISWLL